MILQVKGSMAPGTRKTLMSLFPSIYRFFFLFLSCPIACVHDRQSARNPEIPSINEVCNPGTVNINVASSQEWRGLTDDFIYTTDGKYTSLSFLTAMESEARRNRLTTRIIRMHHPRIRKGFVVVVVVDASPTSIILKYTLDVIHPLSNLTNSLRSLGCVRSVTIFLISVTTLDVHKFTSRNSSKISIIAINCCPLNLGRRD